MLLVLIVPGDDLTTARGLTALGTTLLSRLPVLS